MYYQTKKKGVLMALFLMMTLSLSGQSKNLTLSHRVSSTRLDAGFNSFSSNYFFISARKESFINDVFYDYSQDKTINGGWGIELSYSLALFSPLSLELTGFLSKYDVKGISEDKDTDKSVIIHDGLEFFADVFVLPYVGKISNYVAPYIGIGYQTSSLFLYKEDTSAGTGSALLKLGTQIRLGENIVFRTEYKQSLPISSNKLFSAWDLGISVDIFNY